MEGAQYKCVLHNNQIQLLFCVDDKVKLCVKCVPKHSGHTIFDFEDVCKSIIMPQVEVLRDNNLAKI